MRRIENYEKYVKLGEGWETKRRIGHQVKAWKLGEEWDWTLQ